MYLFLQVVAVSTAIVLDKLTSFQFLVINLRIPSHLRNPKITCNHLPANVPFFKDYLLKETSHMPNFIALSTN